MSESPTTAPVPHAAGGSPEASPPARLHCLGGESAAPEIADDLRQLLTLPEPARRRFWDVLGPSLADPIPKGVDALIERFLNEHTLGRDALTRALRASRVLLRLAVALDLDARRFGEDLAALEGGTTGLAEVLLPGYERATARLKAELARRTVADHGRLLESIRWRVDLMSASDRGAGLRLPVVTLTLHYREGDRREQLSLQVLPDVLKQLRGVCDRVLGRK